MFYLLYSVISTLLYYSLSSWVLQVKKTKKFIVAGLISALLSLIIYLMVNFGKFFTLESLIDIFLNFCFIALWTIWVIFLDSKNKNINWILKYIPILCFLYFFIPVFIALFFASYDYLSFVIAKW